jgi:GTP cyclohydrolase III
MKTEEIMTTIFLALDGDGVGYRLEHFTLMNDTDSLTAFSIKFQAAMDWLESCLIKDFEGQIIFSGGDNLLAKLKINGSSFLLIENLREEFYVRSDSTLSMGIGISPQRAYFALKLAKASGKNCMKRYEEFEDA